MAISVIVYGRNDNHGYNYHKRVALSLNSFAHHLDSEDEIIFVDWNSPEGHPAVPISIADTLTPKAVSLTRVISVPHAIHQAVLPHGVNRHILEPHARNTAIRRVQDESDWILSTNTDVILKPKRYDWREKVIDSSHAYLACPRFELPEFFWETLHRSNPDEVSLRIAGFANDARLERWIESHEYCLYDAPGDFQFVRRQVAEGIGGFDERMVYGWHVDSNFAKRVWLETNSVSSVKDYVQIFHCNHNRTPTHFQVLGNRSNSPVEFVDRISLGTHKPNPSNWGLNDLPVEKVRLEELLGLGVKLVGVAAMPDPQRNSVPRAVSRLSSVERHQGLPLQESWPFLLDVISQSEEPPHVLCLTARPELVEALRNLIPIRLIRSVDVAAQLRQLDKIYGLVITDFTPNFDVRQVNSTASLEFASQDAANLNKVFSELSSVVYNQGNGGCYNRSTRWVFIDAEENCFADVIQGQFHLIPSQFYSRVNSAMLKPVDSALLMGATGALAKGLAAIAKLVRPYRSQIKMRSTLGTVAERSGRLRSQLRSRLPSRIPLDTYSVDPNA